MKVLIWIGCFLVATILNTLLGYAIGIKAGVLVFYFAVFSVAKKLCDKWDEHKDTKEIMKKILENTHSNASETIDQVCFCRRCGEKLIEDSKFCGKCGTQVIKE